MWSNLEIKESISRLGFGGHWHSGEYFEWFWDRGRRSCHIYHPVDPPWAWIRFCEKFNIYLWGGDLEDEGVICARAACRPELLSCSQDHPLHNPPTSPLTENRLAVKSSQRERDVLHKTVMYSRCSCVCVTSHDLSSDPQILSEESCSALPSFLLFVSFQHFLVFPHYTLQPSGIERENRVATQSLAVVFRNTGHGEDKFSRDRTHLLSWLLLLTNSKQLDPNPG